MWAPRVSTVAEPGLLGAERRDRGLLGHGAGSARGLGGDHPARGRGHRRGGRTGRTRGLEGRTRRLRGSRAARQAEAVDLADDGVARDAAELFGDLAGRKAVQPKLLQVVTRSSVQLIAHLRLKESEDGFPRLASASTSGVRTAPPAAALLDSVKNTLKHTIGARALSTETTY